MAIKPTASTKKYNDDTQETDVGKFVFCKAFDKPLRFEHCTKERCNYHFGVTKEEAKQGDKVVEVFEHVLCGYPRHIEVLTACEVTD